METILRRMHFQTDMCMSCVPDVMYGFVFVAENVAIALFRICMMKYKCKSCGQSCDIKKRSTSVTVSRCCGETHFSSAAPQEVWSCGFIKCGFSMQQRLRTISVGSVSSLLLRRTLSVGSASYLLLRPTKTK